MESGSIKVSGCSLEAGANIMGEAGGQLLQLGVAMHRRGAEETMRRVEVKLLVKSMEYMDVGGGGPPTAFGQVLKTTTAQISKSAAATTLKLTGSSSGRAGKLIDKGFNFEELGIGGLDKEFQEIFRRAFNSRRYP